MDISEKAKTLVAGSSVIRRLFEEGKELAKQVGEENVYDYSLGNPYAETPGIVKERILELVKETKPGYLHGYMKNAGYEEVRKAVADSLNHRFDMNYAEDNIIMTVGAAGGLNCVFSTFLNQDDEVICFAPFFGEYRSYVSNFYGKLVVVPAKLPDFRLNLEALASCINKRTKVILLNNPNNPSGVVYPEKDLLELEKIVKKAEARIGHSVCIVSDEPYRELVYDGETVPYMPKYMKNCIVCYSFSKSLSLPGERIGYIAIPPDMEDYKSIENALIVSNRALGYINAPSMFQLVIKACLEEPANVAVYDRNRQMLYKGLRDLGFSCVKPQGAFYMLLKSPDKDLEAFVRKGKEYHLIMVSAESFGCPGYVRLAYCIPYKTVKKSMEAFRKLAEHYFDPSDRSVDSDCK